jgi:histone H3/H4
MSKDKKEKEPKDKESDKNSNSSSGSNSADSKKSEDSTSKSEKSGKKSDKKEKGEKGEKDKKKRSYFGGKAGSRGGRGKPRKQKTLNPPEWHADNIPLNSLTKAANRAGCKRLSKKGKVALANVWVQFVIDAMRHCERYSRVAGRKKTIEFDDVVKASRYWPSLQHLWLENKKYKPPENEGDDIKDSRDLKMAKKRKTKSRSK